MNTSPITAKERLERITNAPKKPGRPSYVEITDPPKKRGRPLKKIVKFFTEESSVEYIKELSASISFNLGVPDGDLTTSLAVAAVSYSVMEQVRYQAPIKNKRRGNRPNIHLTVLLADCAVIHEEFTGEDAKSALRKIGGWAEDTGKPPTVLKYAEAVLSTLEVEHKSLRGQARRAMDLFE